MIEDDDGKGAISQWDLQDAGNGQAIAGVCNWVAGKGVSDEQRRADPDFVCGIVTLAQSGDGIGEDDLTLRCWTGETCG